MKPSCITLVTPRYPTKNDLYSGAFIKARAAQYISKGIDTIVLVLDESGLYPSEPEYISSGEVVMRVNLAQLISALSKTVSGSVFAHSLGVVAMEKLFRTGLASRVIFWFHGFEVRDPMRLSFNFAPTKDTPSHRVRARSNLVLANKSFIERRHTLRRIFKSIHIKKVFVSEYLLRIAEEDVGEVARNSIVISNPIDTEFFDCEVTRKLTNVMFLRPFKAHNYGCDIMRDVIVRYNSLYPETKLRFTICGDGPLHNQYTDCLAKYANVKLLKKFFDHEGIKALHCEHGSMLLPTRFDTQGISMGEAMSSGLVVITNQVAAIPEFADNESAVLCPPNDIDAMVSALNKLEQPEMEKKLIAISRNARKRVLNQVSAKTICEKELELTRVLGVV